MKRLTDRFWLQAWSLTAPRGGAARIMAAIGCIPMLLLAIGLPVRAAVPTGHLNDTGQTRCLNSAGTALEACSSANSGDASPYPRQDGRFGRDPAADNPAQSGFTKPAGSGGSGGFAFTTQDLNGNPIPLVGKPPVPSATPRCIWDRVTNLIWEVKTDDDSLQDKDWSYGWGSYNGGPCAWGAVCSTNAYVADINSINLCGETADDWRLPSRRELLSIVDHRGEHPFIDINFFPNTDELTNGNTSVYWSANLYVGVPLYHWYTDVYGLSRGTSDFASHHVRLVRNGP